jgi:RHS repeat-associated protein
MVEKGLGTTYSQIVYRPSSDSLALYSNGLVKGTVTLPGGGTAIYNAAGLNYLRHKDWLGSSRFATTWLHAVYSKEAYAPFGETYNEWGTADRSFTGKDQDMVTGSLGSGAYDFLFRKYDPSAGRWMSPDPLGWGAVNPTNPQSLDRYVYALDAPNENTDPNGEMTCVWAVSTTEESVFPASNCVSDAQWAQAVDSFLNWGTNGGLWEDSGEIWGPHFDSEGDNDYDELMAMTAWLPDDYFKWTSNHSNPLASSGCTQCHISNYSNYMLQKACDVDACTADEKAQWCEKAKKMANLGLSVTGGKGAWPYATGAVGLGAWALKLDPLAGPLVVLGMSQGEAAYTANYVEEMCAAH